MYRRDYLWTVALGAFGLSGCAEVEDDGGTPADETTPMAADTPTEEATDTPTEEATDTPTEEATDTPTETEPPAAPSDQSFDGSGQEVIDDVDIAGGLTIVEATYDAGGNFIVEFVPADDGTNRLIINVIGAFDGASAVLLEEGTYMIDVTADGDWSLTVRQPRPASGDALPQSLEGDGPEVAGPFEFTGTHTAIGSHEGDGNFIVEVLPSEGQFSELVFNEIGSVDEAETTFSHDGIGFVAVEASGAWALGLE